MIKIKEGYKDKETLAKDIKEIRDIKKIADKYNTTYQNIYNYVIKFKLPFKFNNKGGVIKGKNTYTQKAWLAKQIESKSLSQIANECGVSYYTILLYRNKFKLKTKVTKYLEGAKKRKKKLNKSHINKQPTKKTTFLIPDTTWLKFKQFKKDNNFQNCEAVQELINKFKDKGINSDKYRNELILRSIDLFENDLEKLKIIAKEVNIPKTYLLQVMIKEYL